MPSPWEIRDAAPRPWHGGTAPFEIRASDADLADLARRLDAIRWPAPEEAGWDFGTDPAWLRELVAYWRSDFDWRAREEWLASTLPGRRARIRDAELHYAHVPGRGPSPFPLLLLHGWPSTFVANRSTWHRGDAGWGRRVVRCSEASDVRCALGATH